MLPPLNVLCAPCRYNGRRGVIVTDVKAGRQGVRLCAFEGNPQESINVKVGCIINSKHVISVDE